MEPPHKERAKIKVVVRKRPMNNKERFRCDPDILECREPQTLIVKEHAQKVDTTNYIKEHSFIFDKIFDDSSTNEEIYTETVSPLVEAALNGTKITCFAYGQTGSGKTFTMMGGISENKLVPGIFHLAASQIFESIQATVNPPAVIVAFYEIYCGKPYDLLNERAPLVIREDAKQNVCIVGLCEKEVGSVEDLMEMIAFGLDVRTTGSTSANMDSSRSHAILQISFKDRTKRQGGKISFIDLAGSERGADTMTHDKQTRLDGAEINKALLALKECIRALDKDKKHLPFRGSKLTLVLRDSFIGKCQTLMIANVSPGLSCLEHTLNTLRYADRVKELRKQSKCQTPRALVQTPKAGLKKHIPPKTPRCKPVPETFYLLSTAQTADTALPKEEELKQIQEEHEEIAEKLIEEEQNLTVSHKEHIGLMNSLITRDMQLLTKAQIMGCNITDYMSVVDTLLVRKMESIAELQNKVAVFLKNCEREKELIAKLFEHHNEIKEVFDFLNTRDLQSGNNKQTSMVAKTTERMIIQ